MPSTEIFNFNDTAEIRGTVLDGEPWFVAADVCKALGYAHTPSALRDNVDAEDRGSVRVAHSTAGGNPNHAAVNESGLYALIFGSNKPEAKAFKRWVTSEVLPAIRRDGFYLPATMTRAQVARAAERIQYREAADMLSLASDYRPSSGAATKAFTQIQDMILVKSTGKHAPALKSQREIITWTGKRGPTKADRSVAKNYCTDFELTKMKGLGNVVVGELQLAWPQAGYSVAEFVGKARAVIDAH